MIFSNNFLLLLQPKVVLSNPPMTLASTATIATEMATASTIVEPGNFIAIFVTKEAILKIDAELKMARGFLIHMVLMATNRILGTICNAKEHLLVAAHAADTTSRLQDPSS